MASSQGSVPQGRLARFARMATIGLRASATRLVARDVAASAQQAATVLGTLRGLAAKLGQMASYVDGVVPEKHRDHYESAMKGLQTAGACSLPEEIREVVETELGAEIGALFQRWEEEPIASASIGQVHYAVLHDGREVAVKVQHPGIAGAIDSDLANVGMLGGLLDVMGGKRFDTRSQLEMVRRRFREELDYELEASRIRAFAALGVGDSTVRVLRLVPALCTRRVLTTELVHGLTFEEACAASEDERRAWSETMWRFVFKGSLVSGMFNADPHPGNYLFHAGGAVTFLDFGRVQIVTEHDLRCTRALHQAALDQDEAAFAEAARELLGARPGALGAHALAYLRRCHEPLFASPFHVTRAYAASLVDEMKSLAQEARHAPAEQFFDLPPELLFMNRLQFGFLSVLARLDVEVDYARVEEEFWHEVPQ